MKKKATNQPNQHKNTPADSAGKNGAGKGAQNTRNAAAGKGTQKAGNNRRTVRDKDVAAARPFSRHWIWPLALVVAVIPLITVLHVYDPGMTEYPWFSAETTVFDFFLYYKGFFLILIAILILLLMAWLIPHRDHSFLTEKRELPPVVAIGLFGVLSLISTCVAEHTDVAFFGGYEQFEGCLVLLSYVVCFFFAFGYARTLDTIRFLLDALLIGSTVLGLLGTLQSFGLDWTQTDIGKSLIALEVGGRSGLNAMSIELTANQNTTFATLYNPNYVGSYVSLVLPYSAYLIVRGEKLWRRILAGAGALLLIRTLIAADSAAGEFGVVAGVMVAVVLIFPFLSKIKKILVVCGGVVAIAALAYILISRGLFTSLYSDNDALTQDNISDMVTGGEQLKIETKAGPVILATLNKDMLTNQYWARDNSIADTLTITDEAGNPLTVNYDENGYPWIAQEGYPSLMFYYDIGALDATRTADHVAYEFSQLHVVDVDRNWPLTYVDGSLMFFNGQNGRVDRMKEIPKIGFEGHNGFASGRGYIWARTFPLLTNHLLVGAGPDHFTYDFPQDDYVGKNYWGYNGLITTRPHNLYLQIWVQEGLIAMLAFVFLFFLLLFRALRLCFGKKKVVNVGYGINFRDVAIVSTIATSGYMVAGLANDAIVCVAPVFWVVLGIGYAAEARCRKEFQQ